MVLGALLGSLALAGRDKVTIIASPGIHDLGAWLEQLIAESTGKIGKGLIPVDREPLGAPSSYGSDRVFVYERLENAPDLQQDLAVAALEAAGHPVVRLTVPDVYHLGAEFFRWEIATAVAGSILSLDPFNQPDVEAAKIATKKLTSAFEESGSLPPETGVVRIGDADLESRAAGTSELPARRRLFRTAGLHPDERRARGRVAGHAPQDSRRQRKSPRSWDSGRGSCTPRVSCTKAGRTPACSCRSLATMPRTFRCRVRSTRSEW